MTLSKNYFHAIATLVGTIIGVGMFTIPYVISKSGIVLLFIYLPLLGIVQHFLHRIYAEVILSTKRKHRLPGYAGKYLGKKGEFLSLITVTLGNYGALLAYIIVGGIFLHGLLNPFLGGNVFIYSIILFALEALVVLFGLRLIASIELLMTGLLIFTVGLIVWRGWGHINIDNFSLINYSNVFLPYGPIFFAVGGSAAIPEVCKLLAHKKDNIKSAIAWGTFIPIVIMLIFIIAIVGITGIDTSPDTLAGISPVLSDGVIKFALIFGLLSIITSFLVIAQATREMYWWDFNINRNLAWALACFIPFIVYLTGLSNLTEVVSLTGAITGGLAGIVLIWLIFKVKKKREQASIIINKLGKPMAYGLTLLFILGLFYSVWEFFN